MTATARQIVTGDLPLTIGVITDGQFLKRDGTTIVSAAGGGGGGDALTSNPLSQFASTTSLQLKGVMSDETGSGSLVFGTSPTIDAPTFTGTFTLGGFTLTLTANTTIGGQTPSIGKTLAMMNGLSVAL